MEHQSQNPKNIKNNKKIYPEHTKDTQRLLQNAQTKCGIKEKNSKNHQELIEYTQDF